MWSAAYKVLDVIEYIGETVVSILGLEDSMYQDVLDMMTPEEMARAVAVDTQRREEYRLLALARASILASGGGAAADEEGGGGGEGAGNNDVVGGVFAGQDDAFANNANNPYYEGNHGESRGGIELQHSQPLSTTAGVTTTRTENEDAAVGTSVDELVVGGVGAGNA